MLKRIYSFFSNPLKLAILNAILILFAVFTNAWLQVFCVPSKWAIIMISVCFINTIFYPISIKYKKAHGIIGFINGISFSLFIYCVLFLAHMNLLGFLMIICVVGIVTFIPHFLAIQLIWKSVFKPISKSIRQSFISAIVICCLSTLLIGYQFKQAILEIKKAEINNFQLLEKNFLTEKILGMHFIYHTKFCEFDGWRPPIHEPILVIGLWLNGFEDPLNISLEERIALYRIHFPNNKIKYDCSCAMTYSTVYHHDPLFK